MKLKNVFFLAVIVAVLGGCKKNETLDTVSLGEGTSTLNAGHPIYDLLGYGYDVTGRFADSESSRVQVLDIEKFVSREAPSLPVNNDVSTDFQYSFGENASTFSNDLSQKYSATVGLKLFKGEINTAFKNSSKFSSKYVLASMSMLVKQKRWKLYSTTENLRNNYLSSHFVADVASFTPAALVQKYGTHILTNITLGAKFSVFYQAETSNSDRTNSAKVGLKASGLFKVFGITANYDTDNSETLANFNQTLFYNTFGGDGSKGLIGEIKLDNSAPSLSVANWQSTCNASNAVLIGIDKDGLVSLNELISDPVKSANVKAYIIQYLLDNQVTVINDPSTGSVPLYAYSKNADGSGHYLSRSPNLAGWNGRGIAFRAFATQKPGTLPVYEFYGNYTNGRTVYFYQFGTSQTSFWTNTGVKFYAYPSASDGTVPLYGYTNSFGEDHYFTTDNMDLNGYWKNKWHAVNVFPAQ